MHALIEQLELHARENSKETVLFDETVTKGITYENLNELSGRVYAWLKQKGIGLSMKDPNRFEIDKWNGRNLLGYTLMIVRERL